MADRLAYPGAVLTGQFSLRALGVVGALCILVGAMSSVSCSVQRAGTPTEADLGITPTPAPTATTEPTPTATPTPTPVALGYGDLFDKREAPDLVSSWDVPIAHCKTVGAAEPEDPATALFVPRGVSAIGCIEGDASERPTGVVQAIADARIVQIGYLDFDSVDVEKLETIEQDTEGSVAQWVDAGLLGNHIVLDIDIRANAAVDPPPNPTDEVDPADDATEVPLTTPTRTGDPELDETPDAEPTESDDSPNTPEPTTAAGAETTTTPEAQTTTTPEADEPEADETEADETEADETEADEIEADDPAVSSIQVVYGGMDGDFGHLELGQRVKAGDILGNTSSEGTLLFGVWIDGVRQDDATAIATQAPDKNEQRRVATRLAPLILPPTSPECGLITSQGRLPGAPREYRHGFHQGIDFVCTGDDNEVTAVAEGTVVYLINDYKDASVKDRDALLSRAVPAGNTPYWTLAMLYGNVVVIDHGQIEDIGRVFTISAHLDSVSDDITLGSTVEQDQVIGIVGTTGTNASAQGVPHEDDAAQHLHWELFIDNWYLGQGLEPSDVPEIIVTAVCEDGSPDCD